jgi:hypothetical protein
MMFRTGGLLFSHRCSEAELRSVFSRHGQVQTCIVNKDKRHAFVKMVTRADAVHAKEAMESGTFRVSEGPCNARLIHDKD